MSTGLDRVRLRHRALPERDLEDVSLRTRLADRTLEAPLVIAATDEAEWQAAGLHGIAVLVRQMYPSGDAGRPPLVLAEIGAVEVTGRDGPWAARDVVDRLEADGLAVRLDPFEEATRPDGRPQFAGVLDAIAATAQVLGPRPVVVSGTRFGVDFDDAAALREAGVAALEVGRAGGPADDGAFSDWGASTADALADARAAAASLPLIASGGIETGVDVAKCLALGATAAAVSVASAAGTVIEQLRIATWLAGAPSAQELGREHLR